MTPHSSTLACKVPWMEEPGRLQSMGSLRVGHDWLSLSLFTFTFHFHALEKEMATHSSILAWRIPGTGEPGGLLSMGSHRVGHNWSDLAAAAASSRQWKCPVKREIAAPSASHSQRSWTRKVQPGLWGEPSWCLKKEETDAICARSLFSKCYNKKCSQVYKASEGLPHKYSCLKYFGRKYYKIKCLEVPKRYGM